jgi:amino acid transporter
MSQKGHQFSTFAGVFTPSILTILGVILFLRAGFVIGQGGILNAIWILIGAELISLTTAVSMSAIATNTPVAGGGAYFLISRALGPQFGGAIGLALFLAQALSVPFYILGFTNALMTDFTGLLPWFGAVAMGTAVVLFTLNWISSGMAIRSQYIIMTILSLAILAFMGGALLRFDINRFQENLGSGYAPPITGFWALFAIYFPAVTGILTGVNMSGDLKDPARSLVRGTMAAIVVGFVIYLLQILLCGGSMARADLIADPFGQLKGSALFGLAVLVSAGVYAATLSSAIGSFMGAPRVLQALARDRIFRVLTPFARGSREADEPRLGLLLTLALTVGIILLFSGQDAMSAFDIMAQIVAMFFLCTYGMINLAAFVEIVAGNPSFRPRFRWCHWSVSLLGFIACMVVMFLIDALAATVAVVAIGILYGILSRRVFQAAFGDARRGFQYALVVRTLQKLQGMQPDPKNWRPTFLVLARSTESHLTLMQYADWMEGGRGLVTAAQVFSGDLETYAKRVSGLRSAMESFLKVHALAVFPEIIFAENVDEGIRTVVQAHSIGPLKPNTVLVGWPRTPDRAEIFFRHLRSFTAMDKSVAVVVDKGLPAPIRQLRRIDIWWRGQENGSLMATLAHLLTLNWHWRHSQIRILRHIGDAAGRDSSREAVKGLVEASRLRAEARVVVSSDPFPTVFRQHSAKADVVFMGLQPPAEDLDAQASYRNLTHLLDAMPTAILVHSTGDADLFA